MAATAAAAPRQQTFRYRVELEDGSVYELELDQEIPDTPRGRALLQRLVALELRKQPSETFKNLPTAGSVAEQALGGVIDLAQEPIDMVTDALNSLGLFTGIPTGTTPGGMTRSTVMPQVDAPQLPNVRDPVNAPEEVARTGSSVLAGLALSLLSPAVRRGIGRAFGHQPREVPLMFEPGRAVSRPLNRHTPAVPTMAAELPDILKTRPSEAAGTLGRLVFDLNPTDIPHMSHEAAVAARNRILTKVGTEFDLTQEAGPLKELLDRIESRILMFR